MMCCTKAYGTYWLHSNISDWEIQLDGLTYLYTDSKVATSGKTEKYVRLCTTGGKHWSWNEGLGTEVLIILKRSINRLHIKLDFASLKCTTHMVLFNLFFMHGLHEVQLACSSFIIIIIALDHSCLCYRRKMFLSFWNSKMSHLLKLRKHHLTLLGLNPICDVMSRPVSVILRYLYKHCIILLKF